MAAAKPRIERCPSLNNTQSGFNPCGDAIAGGGSPAVPPADCSAEPVSAPASPAFEGPLTPPSSQAPTTFNLNPAPDDTRPTADLAPLTPSSPTQTPRAATAAAATSRRESKAARALQQLGAACRRISEVGLSAVTSAAASWVLPSAAAKARRGSTALWSSDPEDPEAALSPRNSDLGRGCRSGSSAATTPRKTSTPATKPTPPCARRFGSASHHHSAPQGPLQSDLYGSPRPGWARHLGGGMGGSGSSSSGPSGTFRRGSCSGPLPPPLAMLPPSVLALTLALPAAAIAWAPMSPTDRPAQAAAVPPPPPHDADGADGAAAAGFFRPRVTPADGLLFLAPCARASMWSPQRATKWSLAQYELHRRLYRGYASTVYKATCVTSGTEVVLKVYSLATLTDFLRHQVLRELDIHSRLKHPGIVQLLAAFREGDMLVMVLEYVRGGSLDMARKRLGGRMGEQWALQLVVLPLLRVLSHLHRLGVVHRDIKPENILFTPDWRLKLCDFGVSIYLYEERAVTRAGSSDYMAPEVNACPLKCTPADNKVNEQLAYGAACDVWSLGAVVYELLVGFTPFPGGPPPGDVVPRRGSDDHPPNGEPPAKARRRLDSADAAAAATATTATASRAEAVTAEAEVASAEPRGVIAGGAEAVDRGMRSGGGAAAAAAEGAEPEAAVAEAAAGGAEARGAQMTACETGTAAAEAVTSATGVAAEAAAEAAPPPPLLEASTLPPGRPAPPPPPARSPPSGPSTSSLAFPSRLSPAGRSFLLACLEPHAGDRPTTEELMQHAWVVGAQQGPPPAGAEAAVAPPPP